MSTPKIPVEAPTLIIESEEEYHRVVARLRQLDEAADHSADALEKAALEQALAKSSKFAPMSTPEDQFEDPAA